MDKILLFKRSTQSAFTLLELLIALSLSTLVMLMLAMGMNTVLTEWTRTGNRLEESIDKILLLLQIERALQGAFPHIYKDDNNNTYIFFEGDEEQMTWVSTVSPGRQPGLTAWQLLPNDDETEVQIRIVLALTNNPTEELKKQEAVTLEGYQASFEYLYVDERIKDDSKWLKEWSAKKLNALPNAVRVRLDSNEDDEDSLEVIAVIRANQHPKWLPGNLR
ncbi:prepilin-type N-terminal cleavage/methylation domain-containing protein [Candidatus Parabeggiatoa sp. HSG14]|uniref:prepilin-type N-terminal cleavage/methylation domain-containing protein n=1 Tax=Candidatus Parabeggiatoa sp. HSG14 TaxID=3055593 RepID=UPI0025A8840D|nr:prepilin-type N-terminal cleavage/methylation domain-containing protein [Thiotrichales bacterium HSG14]